MPNAAPVISVLVPVYNASAYINEAIDSVLAQTFADFELILIDDGSADGSLEILRGYERKDSRVRVISRPNTGIVGALNDGLAVARGEFIARIDADDASLPTRFEKQVAFLREHPHVVIVGTAVELIDPYGVPFAAVRQPTPKLAHEEIEQLLFQGNGWAIIHPTVMARREAIERVGRYRQQFLHAEDIDLYLRLAEIGKLANIADVLHRYRQHLASINHTRRDEQIQVITAIVREAHRRRGTKMPDGWKLNWPEPASKWQQHRDWAWRALQVKRVDAARKHALAAVRIKPASKESWRVLYCALRGR